MKGTTSNEHEAAEVWHPKHLKYAIRDLATSADNPHMSVHRGRIEPGGEIYVHTHDNQTESFYILMGEVECTMGERKVAFTAGSCGCAPPGIPHGLRNTGEVPVELLAVFSPPLK